MVRPYQISDEGIDLIETFEGTYTHAYRDPIGIWTICTGHTPASPGETKTPAQCSALLRQDTMKFRDAVLRHVKVEITQGILDALISFAFNVGEGALASSTLLAKLNRRDYVGAAQEFDRWVYAGGRVFLGLQRRRAAERQMFERGYADLEDVKPKLTPSQAKLIGFAEKAETAGALAKAADRLKAQIDRTKDAKDRNHKTDREAYNIRLHILRRERAQALKREEALDG